MHIQNTHTIYGVFTLFLFKFPKIRHPKLNDESSTNAVIPVCEALPQ